MHSPNIEHSLHSSPFTHPSLAANHQLITNGNGNGNDRARAFDIPYDSIKGQNPASSFPLPSQNFHSFTGHPQTHLNSPQFLRPTPDQGLLLSYTQNQANRILHTQSFENRFKNIAPSNGQQNSQQNLRVADTYGLNFGLPSNAAPIKFRTQLSNHQPKPIPIPLHYSDKASQQSHTPGQAQNLNHHQHYTNLNQFRQKLQPTIPNHQLPQFQQSFSQPIHIPNQKNAPELNNYRLTPSNIQSHIHISQSHESDPNRNGNINFSQQEKSNKEHFHQKNAHYGQTASNDIINQPVFSGNAQELNHIVSGAELVESLPKFEQHITETVPLSEINKPFSPFRQLASIQSTGVRSDTSSQRKQNSELTREQQRQQKDIYEKKLMQQSFQNSKPMQQPHAKQQAIYQHEPTNLNSFLPQIVFPINYHTKNYQSQDQKTINQLTSQSNGATAVFHEKVIPGKGVSNLATDVFGDSRKSQKNHNENVASQVSSRNHVSEQNITTTLFNSMSTERSFVTNAHVSSTRKEHEYPLSFTQAKTKIASTSSTSTAKPTSNKVSKLTPNLPDEVPDDLRQQLLSSGILENADISVLDYDKVGDIPLESLPPEHLANFYGAGGAAQISSSNRVLNIVKPNGESVLELQYTDERKNEGKNSKTLPKKHNVDLKIVRFDSTNQKSIADKYIKSDSTVLPSIDINQDYNRYLPLKVNGEQFPIPDVESLRHKKISSVVVLAPVDGINSSNNDSEEIIEDGRYERDVIDSKEVKFFAGDSLKNLLRKPTKEHFKQWLDKEAKTNVDMQSVVLLVVK